MKLLCEVSSVVAENPGANRLKTACQQSIVAFTTYSVLPLPMSMWHRGLKLVATRKSRHIQKATLPLANLSTHRAMSRLKRELFCYVYVAILNKNYANIQFIGVTTSQFEMGKTHSISDTLCQISQLLIHRVDIIL